MEHYEDRFDFHGLGLAIKTPARKEAGRRNTLRSLWGRTSHTIMNIENKGQYPSFGVFVKLGSMFDISVNQFIHSDSGNKESLCRKHIDVLLNTMNEKELVVMEATAEGLKKVGETEVSE